MNEPRTCWEQNDVARLIAAPGDAAEEARAHLDLCAACRTRLARERARSSPPRADASTPMVSGQETLQDRGQSRGEGEVLERGATVGRYVVLERIGFGGMGIVYSAYDPELDRKVAVKLLRTRSGSVPALEAQARLLREAQAMARVSHPNVVAVHDVGTLGDRVFMTMELVDGVTIGEWLRKKPRPWREIVDAFVAAGRGLAAAHAAGLVHRDFKPENVLVDQDGRPRVTDFGLVRPSQSPRDDLPLRPIAQPGGAQTSLPLTQAGSVMGTPGYMSPEQQRAGPTDARTDQFSFCVALYEALYRERPYSLAAFESGKQSAPAFQAPRVLEAPRDSAVPGWVRRILLRGLSADPAGRYPNLDELLAKLSRDPAASLRRWLALGVGLALLLAAGVGVRAQLAAQAQRCSGGEARLAGIWDAPARDGMHRAFAATGTPFAEQAFLSTSAALDSYARGWVAMHTEACQAARIRGDQSEETMSLRMSCLDRRLQEMQSLASVLLKADAQVVEKAVGAASELGNLRGCADVEALRAPVQAPRDAATHARVIEARRDLAEASSLRNAGKLPASLAAAAVAAKKARELHYRPLEGEAFLLLGDLQERTGDAKSAGATLQEALWSAVAGRDDSTAAQAAAGLVRVTGYDVPQFEEAQRWFERGMAFVERQGGNAAGEAELHDQLGSAYVLRDDYDKATEEFGKTFALREKALGPDHLDTVNAVAHQAAVFYLKGDMEAAAKGFGRSIAVKEKLLGKVHPALIGDLFNLGSLLTAEGKNAEALATLQRALALASSGYGGQHQLSAQIFSQLGLVYQQSGDLPRALEETRRGAEALEKTLGPDHPKLGNALDDQASVLLKLDRPRAALAVSQRALAIKIKAGYAAGPAGADSRLGIGLAFLALRQPAQGLESLEQALAVREKQGAPGEKADARFAVARALRALKRDAPRARSLAEAAREIYVAGGAKDEVAAVDAFLAR